MKNPNPVPAKLRTVERTKKLGLYQGSETSRKRIGTGGPNLVPVKLRTVERSASGAGSRDKLAPLHTRPPDAITDPQKEGLFGLL